MAYVRISKLFFRNFRDPQPVGFAQVEMQDTLHSVTSAGCFHRVVIGNLRADALQ